jgi:hypothetical protein
MPRYDEDKEGRSNSIYFDLFHDIFKSFCLKHNLKVDKLLRSSLNLTIPFQSYPFTDPHVDHIVPHYNMLMYLNDFSDEATTILFKEKTDGTIIDHPLNGVNTDLEIETEIVPKPWKVAVFDGLHFHAHRFCKESQRRVICIFTFTVENNDQL